MSLLWVGVRVSWHCLLWPFLAWSPPGVVSRPGVKSRRCQLGLLTCGHHRCLDRDTERNKDVAFLEAQIYEYVEILGVRATPSSERGGPRQGLLHSQPSLSLRSNGS